MTSPCLTDDWAFIEANDIRVDVYTNSSPECSVRLTHPASGAVVTRTGRGQLGVRREAIRAMRERLSQSPPPAPPADGYLLVSTSTGDATWA